MNHAANVAQRMVVNHRFYDIQITNVNQTKFDNHGIPVNHVKFMDPKIQCEPKHLCESKKTLIPN